MTLIETKPYALYCFFGVLIVYFMCTVFAISKALLIQALLTYQKKRPCALYSHHKRLFDVGWSGYLTGKLVSELE